MKGKTKLRVIEILFIISILITVFSVQRTYAKYFEKVGTTYDTNIKKWVININNNNIHEMETLTEVMQPILIENENMNNNQTLVPGREGYFPMLLDYTYVDLAFEYEFTIEQLNINPLNDFEVYGYEIIDGEDSTIVTTDSEGNPIRDKITGVIDPTTEVNSNGEKKKEIRVLFRWNDAEGSTMDNQEDTQFTGEEDTEESSDGLHKILKYKVTATFTQYIAPIEGQS